METISRVDGVASQALPIAPMAMPVGSGFQDHHILPRGLADDLIVKQLTADAGRLLGTDFAFSLEAGRNLITLPTAADKAGTFGRAQHSGGAVSSYETLLRAQLAEIADSPSGRRFLDLSLPDAQRAEATGKVLAEVYRLQDFTRAGLVDELADGFRIVLQNTDPALGSKTAALLNQEAFGQYEHFGVDRWNVVARAMDDYGSATKLIGLAIDDIPKSALTSAELQALTRATDIVDDAGGFARYADDMLHGKTSFATKLLQLLDIPGAKTVLGIVGVILDVVDYVANASPAGEIFVTRDDLVPGLVITFDDTHKEVWEVKVRDDGEVIFDALPAGSIPDTTELPTAPIDGLSTGITFHPDGALTITRGGQPLLTVPEGATCHVDADGAIWIGQVFDGWAVEVRVAAEGTLMAEATLRDAAGNVVLSCTFSDGGDGGVLACSGFTAFDGQTWDPSQGDLATFLTSTAQSHLDAEQQAAHAAAAGELAATDFSATDDALRAAAAATRADAAANLVNGNVPGGGSVSRPRDGLHHDTIVDTASLAGMRSILHLINKSVWEAMHPRYRLPTIFHLEFVGFGNWDGPTPLVLDLAGTGVSFVDYAESGARFDAAGDGTAEKLGWIEPTVAFLVLDRNGNGRIDDASEWFGERFSLDGSPPPANQTGLQALATLARAGARELNPATSRIDPDTGGSWFSKLKLWVDADRDGQTDVGELRSLGSYGIAGLSLLGEENRTMVGGNGVLETATFRRTDGTTGSLSDVVLADRPVESEVISPVDRAVLEVLARLDAALPSKAAGTIQAAREVFDSKLTALSNANGQVGYWGSQGKPMPLTVGYDGLRAYEHTNANDPYGFVWIAINRRDYASTDPFFGRPDHVTRYREIWGLSPTTFYISTIYGGTIVRDRDVFSHVQAWLGAALQDLGRTEVGMVRSLTDAVRAAADTVEASLVAAAEANTHLADPEHSVHVRATDAALAVGTTISSAIAQYFQARAFLGYIGGYLVELQGRLEGLLPADTGGYSFTWYSQVDAYQYAALLDAQAAATEALGAAEAVLGMTLQAFGQLENVGHVVAGGAGGGTLVADGTQDNLLIGGPGEFAYLLGAGQDIVVRGSWDTHVATVRDFQPGAGGDRLMLLVTDDTVDVYADGEGVWVLFGDPLNPIRSLLAGLTIDQLSLYANLSGITVVRFDQHTQAVSIDLCNDSPNRLAPTHDGRVHVRDVSGTRYGDRLTGDASGNALLGWFGNDTLDGGIGADRLIGDAGNDRIVGGSGDDTLSGGGGNDTLVGGDGIDVADYGSVTSAVRVSLALAGAQSTGGGGTDQLSGIENITGSGYADALTGDAGTNVLSGGSGRDTLVGADGADTLVAGNGDDSLAGGNGDDSMGGGDGNDSLVDASGNDTLVGGAGDDTLSGGAGSDEASYVNATAGVQVSLAIRGAQTTGGGGIDVLLAVENLTGSAFADVLTGNEVANVLVGMGGNDTLGAAAGADSLDGGLGNDSLDGGDGRDTLLGGLGNDTISGGTGGDIILVRGAVGLDVITDFVDTGGAGDDVIRFVGYGTAVDAFTDLHITYAQGNATITLTADGPAAGTITLLGITAGLDSSDFLFT